MKGKRIVMFSIAITFFNILCPNAFASSQFVIGEETAGGYHYTVYKADNKYTWKIGHQDNLSTINENKDNIEALERFRTAVEDINLKIVEISISATYFLIVGISSLIAYKKNKPMPKSTGAIIALLAGIALYYTFINSIDLHRAFQDANYYYLILTF